MGTSSSGWGHGGRRRGAAALEGHPMTAFLHRVDVALVRLAWLPRLVLLVAVVMVVIQAMDRHPPFEVLSVEPVSARAGEVVTITAKVRRDTDYPVVMFSDAMIDNMHRMAPGVLRVSIVVPSNAAPGAASLVSVLRYRCNRTHALWPIEVTTELPFTVAP
jgi:hypothetical protein